MALSKLTANSFDLTDNYALTGTVTGVTSTQKLFLIKNLDASSSATRTFIDGSGSVDLDNTYKTYLFRFVNIHPATDSAVFQFQGSTQGSSSSDGDYANNITSTSFQSFHDEADSSTGFSYDTGGDLANSSSFQNLSSAVGNGNDESLCGELYLFNPSNTTFVKPFISRTNFYNASNFSHEKYVSGYINTTSAINAIRFKFSSGNIDSGRIGLYGIK